MQSTHWQCHVGALVNHRHQASSDRERRNMLLHTLFEHRFVADANCWETRATKANPIDWFKAMSAARYPQNGIPMLPVQERR